MRSTHIWIVITGVIIGYFLCFNCCAAGMKGLRGQRYCEILLGPTRGIPKTLRVYNTIGLSDCPQDVWKKITKETIKKEENVNYVRLNGPRYWVIDGFQNTTLINPAVRVLGGLKMREAGVLRLSVIDIIRGENPLAPHLVDRNTTWIYQAGKPIYELIDPKGQTFVMQSYSSQKVEQSEQSLIHLGEKLKLPKGWHFQTRVLKENAYLTPIDQKAVVIQDEFLNTYQQETPDFVAPDHG